VFEGRADLILDSKGRLGIPARFHDALAAECKGRLVITARSNEHLLIYPEPTWDRISADVMARSNVGKAVQRLQRFLSGLASRVEMDATGRVLVSPELRAHAGLTRSVSLLGVGGKFELWDKARLDAELADPVDLSAAGAGLEGLSL